MTDCHWQLRRNVIFIALASRLVVLLLQFILNLLPDHHADAFSPNNQFTGFFDFFLRSTFDGLTKWDSKYFLHVAEYGYTTEQTFAFFPLFPLTIRYLASPVKTVLPFLSFYTCCILTSVAMNFVLFVGSTLSLFDLTLNIFENQKFAYITSVLFSFNASSIFFSSCYTEAMYSFLVFKSLSVLYTRSAQVDVNQLLQSSLFFSLASCTRSNGIINCGFIIYMCLHFSKKTHVRNFQFLPFLLFLFRCVVLCLPIIAPYILFNAFGYLKYCRCVFNKNFPNEFNCSSSPEWCNASLPSVYSHIQKTNWGLGLFAYYQYKKLPNFFLAMPITILSIHAVFHYMLSRTIEEILSLELISDRSSKIAVLNKFQFASKNLFPFIVHLSFLVTFAWLFMHVEVTTRMVLSSTPVIYWSIASYILNDLVETDAKTIFVNNWSTFGFMSKFCIMYFISYFILGILLHCNFLPWT